MDQSDISQYIIVIAALAAAIWILDRLRYLVVKMITRGIDLTEREFWLENISTKEHASKVLRRSYRDLYGLTFLYLILELHNGNYLFFIVFFILVFLLSKKSRIAAILLMILPLSVILGTIYVSINSMENNVVSGAIVGDALNTILLLIISWIAWRAFKSIIFLEKSSSIAMV